MNENIIVDTDKNNKHVPHRDDCRKLALLVAIDKIDKPKLPQLEEALGYSPRAILTMFTALEGVGVVIKRINGRRYGYYEIVDPGVFHLGRASEIIKTSYSDVFQQINCIALSSHPTTEVRNNPCLNSQH